MTGSVLTYTLFQDANCCILLSILSVIILYHPSPSSRVLSFAGMPHGFTADCYHQSICVLVIQEVSPRDHLPRCPQPSSGFAGSEQVCAMRWLWAPEQAPSWAPSLPSTVLPFRSPFSTAVWGLRPRLQQQERSPAAAHSASRLPRGANGHGVPGPSIPLNHRVFLPALGITGAL